MFKTEGVFVMISKAVALIAFSGVLTTVCAMEVFPVGAKISEIEIVLANGQPIKFDAIPKQVTVLVLGASWCPPCTNIKMDMRGSFAAEAIAKAPNLRFVYVGINSAFSESGRTDASASAPFNQAYVDVEKLKANGTSTSPSGNYRWVASAYYFSTVAYTIIVDNKGAILARGAGMRSLATEATTLALKQ